MTPEASAGEELRHTRADDARQQQEVLGNLAPEQAFPEMAPEDWGKHLLWLLNRDIEQVEQCLGREERVAGFHSAYLAWHRDSIRGDPSGPRKLYEICREFGVIRCMVSLGALPLSGRRLFQVEIPKAFVTGGDTPLKLSGTPEGLRAEVRLPRPGRRSLTHLALTIDSWAALKVDREMSVELGVVVFGDLPKGVPWADWLQAAPTRPLGSPTDDVHQWTERMAASQRTSEIPLTRPGATLDAQQNAALRDWLAAKRLHILAPMSAP